MSVGFASSWSSACSPTPVTSTPSTGTPFEALEGFADISVENLRRAIEASKERTLDRLLVGLNIRHVGGTVAEILARRFGNLDGSSPRVKTSWRRSKGSGRRSPTASERSSTTHRVHPVLGSCGVLE